MIVFRLLLLPLVYRYLSPSLLCSGLILLLHRLSLSGIGLHRQASPFFRVWSLFSAPLSGSILSDALNSRWRRPVRTSFYLKLFSTLSSQRKSPFYSCALLPSHACSSSVAPSHLPSAPSLHHLRSDGSSHRWQHPSPRPRLPSSSGSHSTTFALEDGRFWPSRSPPHCSRCLSCFPCGHCFFYRFPSSSFPSLRHPPRAVLYSPWISAS